VAINTQGSSQDSIISNSVVPFASVPGKPTFINSDSGPLSASVYFVPPSDDGGSPILYYYVRTTPDRLTQPGANTLPNGWNQGTASPVLVTNLRPGSYLFQVVAHNLYGDSLPSDLVTGGTIVGVGIPDAPTEVFAAEAGDGAVKVYFQQPDFDGGQAIQNYTVTSNPGQYRVTTSSSTTQALYSNLPDGTYRFIVYATNSVGNSMPSLQSNSVTITSSSPQLLALWIVLGILGFVGILVGLYFLRRCLIARKNNNHEKISKQTTTGDNEMVIVKDTGHDMDVNTTKQSTADVEEGNTSNTTKTSSTDPDDESNWVSH